MEFKNITMKITDYDKNKRADESATPWKDNFENLYNDIVKVVTVDGEEMTDGECVDALFSVLKKYRGESDEQTEVKF